jgi:DNA-binding response OmpR family regulator
LYKFDSFPWRNRDGTFFAQKKQNKLPLVQLGCQNLFWVFVTHKDEKMKINKTIIICDDDEGILEMLAIILEDSGYNVIAEQNSLNLYNLIEQKKPDLLLLDLWMPVLSGDQVLLHLRSQPATKTLPVIVLSASTDGPEIASKAGATDYIAKPFDIDQLLTGINGILTYQY